MNTVDFPILPPVQKKKKMRNVLYIFPTFHSAYVHFTEIHCILALDFVIHIVFFPFTSYCNNRIFFSPNVFELWSEEKKYRLFAHRRRVVDKRASLAHAIHERFVFYLDF